MAGINGLEVGQSMVSASSMLIYFALSIYIKGDAHIYGYSVVMLVVFLGGALILLRYN